MIDLRAYFERIGFTGPHEPTLATLNQVVLRHVQSIPFENLDVLLDRRIWLTAEGLEQKLVHERRGGYCFEQNGLLLLVLEAMGFEVKPISARVRYQRPREFTPARTHLFVRVELEGQSWLADVGVGAMSPTAALRLTLDEVQETPHEARRLIREGELYFHQVRFGTEWHDVNEFTLEQMPPIDREVASWFTSTHPDSHFRNRLIAARALGDGQRRTLVNRELSLRDRTGVAQTRLIKDPDELVAVLDSEFGLRFDASTRFACSGLDWAA